MSLRKRISAKSSASAEEEFKRFIIAKKAKGLADKTLKTYQQHLSAISKHLDLRQSIEKLNTNNLEQMIVSMREAGLSSNYNYCTAPSLPVKARPPVGGGCLAADSDALARRIWNYPLFIFTFEVSLQMCEKFLTLPSVCSKS